MQKLLHPAISLMNRLRYAQKFLLISILFVAPLALVMTLLVVEVNSKADFARKELYGDTYLRSVRQLFEHALQEQSIAHAYLNGNTSLQDEFLATQAQIDRDLNTLAPIDGELGQTLKTSEKFNAAQGVKLLGAQIVLTGIRPEVAQTLVGIGVDLGEIVTRSTLQSGIAYATRGPAELRHR